MPANSPQRFCHFVHSVPGGDASAALSRALTNGAGWVFVTDQGEPNPWGVLPSYLDEELATNLRPNEELPDVTAMVRYNDSWGHIQLSGLMRKIGFDTLGTPGNEPQGSEFGWGLMLGGVFKVGLATFRVGGVYGEGIASYMNDGGMDLAPSAALVPSTPTPTPPIFPPSLPPVIGDKTRMLEEVPDFTLEEGMTIVIQPNVVNRDESAGVQTGELVVVTSDGAERFHDYERGLLRIG